VRLTTSPRKKTNCYEALQWASELKEYPTKTKDHGFDIWHMERSDHAAAREDDGDSRLSLKTRNRSCSPTRN